MLRAQKTHYLLWLLAASIFLNSACSSCGKKEVVTGENPAQPVAQATSTLPFSTKEPAIYQAEIVISFPGANTTVEQKYFIARDGEKRRIDYEFSEKETMSVLEDLTGRTIVLPAQKKCATEERTGPERTAAGSLSPPQGEPFNDFLTSGWLAEKTPANFEDLGRENVAGKSLAKFRVRYEKVNGVESVSEAFVWVDEEIGMPVRTEFYSLKNGEKADVVITEFRNLKLNVNPDMFDKPAGCQNISAGEMRDILWRERVKSE